MNQQELPKDDLYKEGQTTADDAERKHLLQEIKTETRGIVHLFHGLELMSDLEKAKAVRDFEQRLDNGGFYIVAMCLEGDEESSTKLREDRDRFKSEEREFHVTRRDGYLRLWVK